MPVMTAKIGRVMTPRPGQTDSQGSSSGSDTIPTRSGARGPQPVRPASAERDPRIGKTLGKYLLSGVLGRGGMGVVYEAQDSVLKRSVAVKLLPDSVSGDSNAVQRFLREAQ